MACVDVASARWRQTEAAVYTCMVHDLGHVHLQGTGASLKFLRHAVMATEATHSVMCIDRNTGRCCIMILSIALAFMSILLVMKILGYISI